MLALFCGYGIHTSVHRFDGIVGMTRKNGFGCYCHNAVPTPSVRVWVEGPAILNPGETGLYRLKIVGDSTRTAGFNLASAFGSLEVVDSSWTYWYEGELTHALPRPVDESDTVSWQFRYVAPSNDGLTVDTLYSVGNSTNQDTMATDADQWNFGEDFLIAVTSVTSVGGPGNQDLPSRFVVYQNYPNPFNPVTTIRFDLPQDASVKLSLYDAAGRLIAVLDDKHYSAGSHHLLLDADRFRLSSGVYFCRLELTSDRTAPSVVVRKLALIR
jgi:hypothetical protein